MNKTSRSSGDQFMNALLVILVALAVLGGAGLYMFRKHQLAVAVEYAREAEQRRAELQRQHELQRGAFEDAETGGTVK